MEPKNQTLLSASLTSQSAGAAVAAAGEAARRSARTTDCSRVVTAPASMGPGRLAVGTEIVRIARALGDDRARRLHRVGDAVVAGVGFRFLDGLKGQPDLGLGIAARGIPHQRLDFPRT